MSILKEVNNLLVNIIQNDGNTRDYTPSYGTNFSPDILPEVPYFLTDIFIPKSRVKLRCCSAVFTLYVYQKVHILNPWGTI